MPTKMVYIFEPALAKSKALAKLLEYAEEPVNTVFVALDEAERSTLDQPDTVLWQDVKAQLDEHAVLLPTGIISTKIVLADTQLKRGNVVMNMLALDVCNKPWLLEQAENIGIPTPRTWRTAKEIAEFPVFFKEEFEAGGGIRGIADKKRKLPKSHDTLIFQELIKSKGTYGVAFWAEHGQLMTSVSHFEEYSLPASGGSAVYLRHFSDPRLSEYTSRLIKELNYTGWGLAEFKFDPKRKDYVLMEINAKIWASIEFSLRINAELATYILGTSIKTKPLSELVFKDNFKQRKLGFKMRHAWLLTKPTASYRK